MQKESNRNAPSRLRFRLSPFTLFRRSGGHPPVENLFETCTKGELERRPPPIDLVLPPGSDLPNGETACLGSEEAQASEVAERKSPSLIRAKPGEECARVPFAFWRLAHRVESKM